MTVVFPFHRGDVDRAKHLLTWIKQLGGCKHHNALLVADAGISWAPVLELRELAAESFDTVDIASNQETVAGWPAGPNSLFSTALQTVADNKLGPWFWCETDCIPLKPAWVDMLQDAYTSCGKQYMGAIVPCDKPGLPAQHLNGNAVYPQDAVSVMAKFCSRNRAFDIASAEEIVPLAANTFRIQHFWGQVDLPPTFSLTKTDKSPINTFTLDRIKDCAVIFHRNKDGTLIRCLWNKFFPKTVKTDSVVLVIPFCHKDSRLAVKNVNWMKRLHPEGYKCDVILCFDERSNGKDVQDIEQTCISIFKSVSKLSLPKPRFDGWPGGPNYMLQSVALHIYKNIKRPWFFMEPDMIPLKRGWLDSLFSEYYMCGKPFMGSVIEQMGHMNGAGFYPYDFPERCPKAMETTMVAWDCVMAQEMIGQCHDASRLMQHLWGIYLGSPHFRLGPAPTFNSNESMKWVKPDAVVLHRCKDGSLIDMLSTSL